MMKPAASACLDQRLIYDILRGVEALRSLAPFSQQDPFKQFKEDFRERYEAQEVPLALALDEEVGIGFERNDSPGAMPEPLIENLDFRDSDERPEFKATKPEVILLRKLEELAQQKNPVLELDAKLLQSLRTENPQPLPDAFAVMGHVIAQPSGANKYSFYLQSASGPSGAVLLGRFCHADDHLAACVKEHLRAEEALRAGDSVIFAEVAHLPEGRVGNVLFRPFLRDYEIPFLAASRAPSDRQIPITDLTVSVENDCVILRSRRLGCEVVPRLTSAHGYIHERNLKLYKFLCLLQGQGVSGGVTWNWGILEQADFLPRVIFRNIVLSHARWLLTREVIEELSGGSGPERLRRFEEWRLGKAISRFLLLSEADNQLLIDFENVLSVETLIEYIRNRESARLVEMVPSPDCLCAHGPEGSFTHEVVIPFVRSKPQPAKPERVKGAVPVQAGRSAVALAGGKRSFLPGSEWLFAKIYASPSHVDRLLLEHIKPLLEKVLAAGEVDGWFFVRYGDPHWHLRLRLHGDPRTLSAQVLPQLWDCVDRQRQQGRMWRLQLDTYERELERYGGLTGIRIAERLFQCDSELALELLASISEQLGGKVRWHLAFLSVDSLLSGLGLELSARRELANNMGNFGDKNLHATGRYRKQLSERFRSERQILESLLEGSGDLPPSAHSALARFAERMETIRVELEQAWQAAGLAKPVSELTGSYVHMHLNRIFRSAPNAQEIVLYDFLARTYDSRIAREKQKATAKAFP